MSKRLIEYDPLTKVSTYSNYDELKDELTISTHQDITEIIDWNKKLQNDPEYWKKGVKGEMAHFASIPNVIIEKWLIEDGVNIFDKNNHNWLKRKLASPECKYLRVTEKINL